MMTWVRTLQKTFGGGTARARASRVRPGVEALESRLVPYATTANFWPHPQLITLSFVPDGTVVGSNGFSYLTSNLFATLNAKFGSASVWENQILKAAQVWAQQTNVNFAVVQDDGSYIGSGSYQQGDPAKGDIRISGYNFGTSTLASADMAPQSNNYSIAGDMQFNTGQAFNIGSTYDLYTVAMHEFGHALGLDHSSSSLAVMYPNYLGSKSGLNSDDTSGIRAIYSNGNPRSPDRYYGSSSPNSSFAAAANITSLIAGSSKTAVVNNLDITTAGETEYYTFTAPAGSAGSLSVSVQSSGLSLLAPKLTVYDTDRSTVLGSATGSGTRGSTLSVTVNDIDAGQQFYVQVAGANTTSFGTGAYALTLNLGTGPAPSVTPPNTQTANGTPLSGGGGLANSTILPNPWVMKLLLDLVALDLLSVAGGPADAAAVPLPSPQSGEAGVAAVAPHLLQGPAATGTSPRPLAGDAVQLLASLAGPAAVWAVGPQLSPVTAAIPGLATRPLAATILAPGGDKAGEPMKWIGTSAALPWEGVGCAWSATGLSLEEPLTEEWTAVAPEDPPPPAPAARTEAPPGADAASRQRGTPVPRHDSADNSADVADAGAASLQSMAAGTGASLAPAAALVVVLGGSWDGEAEASESRRRFAHDRAGGRPTQASA
jgi:hypothetical protein